MAEVGNAAGKMYVDFDVMPDDLPCAAGTDYVSCKEDIEYDDLCTLESLLSYFKHDESLDKEIANLKMESLLNTIEGLKVGMQLKDNDIKAARETVNNCMDALMLMSHVKPEDIPAGHDFIKKAINHPHMLLNYIPEDEVLTWPVTLINDGTSKQVTHGLNTNMEDV